MLVFSEVLNLKCYAGPLILGQAVYQRHWHLSETESQTWTSGEPSRTGAPRQKGQGEDKDLGSSRTG